MKPDKPVVITVGRRCGNTCGFCDMTASKEPPDLNIIHILLELERRRGADKVVLSGREPLSEKRWKDIVRAAIDSGFRSIRIETCGALLADKKLADAVSKSGVTELSMTVASDPDSWNKVCGNDDLEKTIQGITNTIGRVKKLQVTVPVFSGNVWRLVQIVRFVHGLGVRYIIFDVSRIVKSSDETDIESALVAVDDALQAAIDLGMAAEHKGREFLPATSHTDGRFDKTDDSFCTLTYFKPGRSGKRELFSADFRLTYLCNQRCVFCDAHTVTRQPGEEELRNRLIEVLKQKPPRIFFEGGEPTLSPLLPEFLERSVEAGVRDRIVMTNGVRAADSEFAKLLAGSGASRVFVSLHGQNADVSDAITQSAGTFEKSVAGVRNLMDAGISTSIIFVMMSTNIEHIPEFLRFVKSTFGVMPIFFSMVAPYITPSLDRKLIPSYTELRPVLLDAWDVAEELGLSVSAMEEQHKPPKCAFMESETVFRNLFAPLAYAAEMPGFVKPEQCQRCSIFQECPGVRDYYATAKGVSEIIPII